MYTSGTLPLSLPAERLNAHYPALLTELRTWEQNTGCFYHGYCAHHLHYRHC